MTFSINIGVYDNSGINLETNVGIYIVSLNLSPTGSFSGMISGTTSSGVITLSNLRILSAGTFNIIVSSAGITSATSSSLTITNYVYAISLASSTSTPTANFPFTITVTLKGEDNNLFTGISTTVLTCANTLSGITSLSNSGGTVTFSIYFTSLGSQVITATSSSITGNITISVLSEILKIITFTPVLFMQPSLSTTVFSITIGVYDNTGISLETTQSYQISIALSPTGTMIGTLSGNTLNGQIAFNGLKILSSGTFSIIGRSTGIISITSNPATVTNLISCIEITSNAPSPSAFFEFSLAINIIGEDNTAFTGSCDLSLSTSPSSSGLTITGNSIITTTNGTAIFNIYFSYSGSKIINTGCNSITNSTTLIILDQILKIIRIHPIVISI